MCDRYKYVQIFYERGILSGNSDLVEIKDEAILSHMKSKHPLRKSLK